MAYFYSWGGGTILIVQLLFVVHAVRTGRSSWIWIILLFPLIGAIAYAISEVRPGRGGRRLAGQLVSVVQPSQRLNELRARLDDCPNVENRMELAREHALLGHHAEAIVLYGECLSGVHADDPEALKGLASSQLEIGAFADAKATLVRMFRATRERTPVARLLFARAVEGADDAEAALAAYEDARAGAVGDEMRSRHALLLDKIGRIDEARAIWTRVVKESERADGRYRRDNREWISIAKQKLGDDA